MKLSKALSLSILPLLFVSFTPVAAQLPDKPEDIAPLLIGEKIPRSEMKDVEGNKITSTDILQPKYAYKSKRTVLIYFKGSWSSENREYLQKMNGLRDTLAGMGYDIVAVSSDAPAKAEEFKTQDSLRFDVISDNKGELMKNLGIAFHPQRESEKKKLVEYSYGSNIDLMPVPSLFIVDEKETILFEYISPTQTDIISKELLISAADILRAEK